MGRDRQARLPNCTADRDCIGSAKLVVFCNAPEDNPFMAGAFHGPGEPDCVINVGVSGPGVVRAALSKAPRRRRSDRSGRPHQENRLQDHPHGPAGRHRSIASGWACLSASLTCPWRPPRRWATRWPTSSRKWALRCAALTAPRRLWHCLNDAVKKGGVMASSHVGGLSGAFIPVSEDAGMIDAARCGALSIEKLEAMTAVCSVGLDMIVLPGDMTRGNHLGHHRRRSGHRHGQLQDHCCARHPRHRQESRRRAGVRRPFGQRPGDENQLHEPRHLYPSRRTDSRPASEPQKLNIDRRRAAAFRRFAFLDEQAVSVKKRPVFCVYSDRGRAPAERREFARR